MRLLFTLTALMVVTPAMADETASDLAKAWWKANDLCQRSHDPTVSKPSCETRVELDRKLAQYHWCYGQLRNFPSERTWYRCGR